MSFFLRRSGLLVNICVLCMLFFPHIRVTAADSTPGVLINEIMPRPSNGGKWVELYNPTDSAVTAINWKIDYDGDVILIPSERMGAHTRLFLSSSASLSENSEGT